MAVESMSQDQDQEGKIGFNLDEQLDKYDGNAGSKIQVDQVNGYGYRKHRQLDVNGYGLDADGFKEHHEGDEVSGSSGNHGDEGSYLKFIGDKSGGEQENKSNFDEPTLL